MRARLVVVLVVACGLHEAIDRAVPNLAAVLDPVLDGLAKVELDEDAREAVLVRHRPDGLGKSLQPLSSSCPEAA